MVAFADCSRSILFFLIIFFMAVLVGCEKQSQSEGRIEVNGTELYYKTMGSGEPIVIVHGGPVLDHSYLVPHLKPLAENYQLIFYDQRLSGRSSAEVDSAEVTMQNFVDDIEGLRRELELGKINVLAHSWGGLLAMKYAIAYPGQVDRLVLSNPMPPSAALWQKEEIALSRRVTAADREARNKITATNAFRNREPAAIEEVMKLSFSRQFHDSSNINQLDLYIPGDYDKRSGKFGLLMPELQSYDLIPALQKLQIPTLVIYGSDEPADTLSGPLLNNTIPNSEFVTIRESGHFPFIEQPDAFMEAVRTFLNEGTSR